MAYRQLHTYPKSFNDQASLKTFPFRRPLRMNYWNVGVISLSLYLLIQSFQYWSKYRYSESEFFKKDVNIPSFRKPNFFSEKDRLIP